MGLSPARGFPHFNTLIFEQMTPTPIATAGAVSLTAAQVLNGLILRDPAGAGRTDTLPTAAALVAAIPGIAKNQVAKLTIRNDAAGAFTVTVQAGAGGTLNGAGTIAQNATKVFLIVFTNVTPGAEAYTAYSAGSTGA